jgi:hypothetical protein
MLGLRHQRPLTLRENIAAAAASVNGVGGWVDAKDEGGWREECLRVISQYELHLPTIVKSNAWSESVGALARVPLLPYLSLALRLAVRKFT